MTISSRQPLLVGHNCLVRGTSINKCVKYGHICYVTATTPKLVKKGPTFYRRQPYHIQTACFATLANIFSPRREISLQITLFNKTIFIRLPLYIGHKGGCIRQT